MSSSHAAPASVPADEHVGHATGGKVAMWLFIAQDGFSFGGLLLAYAMLRTWSHDWPNPSHILGIKFTAVGTFVLICSSLTMVMAVAGGQANRKKALCGWLFATIR